MLCLFLVATDSAQVIVEQGSIVIKLKNRPLSEVLVDVKNKTGINFIYNDVLIQNKYITCNIKSLPVDNGISELLSIVSLNYRKFDEKNYVLIKKHIPKKKVFEAVIEQKSNSQNEFKQKTVVKPVLVSKGEPIYPSEAQQRNIFGKVEIKLLINEDGKVSRSLIDKTSGYSILDQAASKYCENLVFKPASINEKPVKIWMSLIVNYKIEGTSQ